MNCCRTCSCRPNSTHNNHLLSFNSPSYTAYDYSECDLYEISPQCKKGKFMHDIYLQKQSNQYYWITESFYLWEKYDKSICILHLQSKHKNPIKSTIIYFQSSTSNLATIYSHLYDIVSHLKCDLITFDYSGCGQSKGTFTETNICSDAEAILSFINEMNIPKQHLILLGFSIGCIPLLHYASKYKELFGCILINPANFADIQKSSANELKYSLSKEDIKVIRCPVLFIHGKKDEMNLYERTVLLYRNGSYYYSWFPKNGGHLNIFKIKRRKMMETLKMFVMELSKLNREMVRDRMISVNNNKHNEDIRSCWEGEKNVTHISYDESNRSYVSNDSRMETINKFMVNEFNRQGIYK